MSGGAGVTSVVVDGGAGWWKWIGPEVSLAIFGRKDKKKDEAAGSGAGGGGSSAEGGASTGGVNGSATAAAGGATGAGGEKETAGATGSASGGGEDRPLEFSPEKAQKFFDHARAMHESGTYDYAMTLWLGGLKHNPLDIEAIEHFWSSALGFLDGAKTKKLDKESLRQFDGKTKLDRFLSSLLQWGAKPTDPFIAVKTVQLSAALGLTDVVKKLGERAQRVAAAQAKPNKDHFVTLLESFESVGAFEMAVQCGDVAVKLDPTNNKLAARVRNLSAESTMTRGGFDQVGQAGGFMANVRDASKQRQLDESERLVKSDDVRDRLIAEAGADLESRPDDRGAIKKYVRLLLERGTPADEKSAYEVLSGAYKRFGEFGFLESANEIALRQMKRKVERLAAASRQADATPEIIEQYEQSSAKLVEARLRAAKLAVENYPTDLAKKYELGVLHAERGEYQDAIALFQAAQSDTRLRLRVLGQLGAAFAAIGWHAEAVETYRHALEVHPDPEGQGALDLRYGLLCALQSQAEAMQDLASADEADKLASSIARQNISFKDIRDRRDQIKQLAMELRRTGGSGG